MVQFAGVRFYRTEAEKLSDKPFSKINVNLAVKDAQKLSKKEMHFVFSYDVDYFPKVATLKMLGHLVVVGTEKEINNTLLLWKKTKKVPPALASPIANVIAYSSEVNGVLVAKAIGIPVPVVPPNIQLNR